MNIPDDLPRAPGAAYRQGFFEGREAGYKMLRDEIAMRAMQGIISNAKSMSEITNQFNWGKFGDLEFEDGVARLGYIYADAMLKARQGDE